MPTSVIDSSWEFNDLQGIAWLTTSEFSSTHNSKGQKRSGEHVYLFLEYMQDKATYQWWDLVSLFPETKKEQTLEVVDFIPKQVRRRTWDFSQSSPESLFRITGEKRGFKIDQAIVMRILVNVEAAKNNIPVYDRNNPDITHNKHNCASAAVTLLEASGVQDVGTTLTSFGVYTPANVTMATSKYLFHFAATQEGRECCKRYGEPLRKIGLFAFTGLAAIAVDQYLESGIAETLLKRYR